MTFDRNRLREAMGTAPLALRNETDFRKPAGLAETVEQAVVATRRILSQMPFPTIPDIRYVSIRDDKHGRVVNLTASFMTESGHRTTIDIPVLARSSGVVDPGVFHYNGTMRFIAQSSISDLVRANTSFDTPPRPGQYSPPPTLQESQAQYESLRHWKDVPRSNRNLYAARVRAAMGTEAIHRAYQAREAQITDAVILLDEWKLPTPESDEAMQAMMDKLIKEHNIDPIDALEAIDTVYELWHEVTARRVAAPMPPAAGDILYQVLPPVQTGGNVLATVLFDAEQARSMSDSYIMQMAVTALKANAYRMNLGFIAAPRVIEFNRDSCSVVVSFTSSKIHPPQLAGGALRVAAIAPEQKKTHLDPAERKENKDNPPCIGDVVHLKDTFKATSRGGRTVTYSKGESGKVVKDVYGDGEMLQVSLSSGLAQIPRRYLTAQAQETDHDEIVAYIRSTRELGYPPIDAIMGARQKFGASADAGIKRAKALNLILPL